MNNEDIGRRKKEHIDICLNNEVAGLGEGTGFERYRFRHLALPDLDFNSIDMSCRFLGRSLKAPFMISSMTGGTDQATRINIRLAEAAESRGWAMGLGSLRAAIERPETAPSFQVRKYAPSIPLLANLGAVQLNYGFGVEQCRQAVALTEADGLILHLNGLQEVFQPEGNTDFRGLLRKIEQLCRQAEFPIGVKEVGWGIDGGTVSALYDAGVAFVDVAGAGGTSWSQVEKYRSTDPVRKAAAEAFGDWGIPTAECIIDGKSAAPACPLIASGGMESGVDAAKAVALGADLVSFGRALLSASVNAGESLELRLQTVEFQFRAAMFAIGAGNLEALRNTDRLMKR